MFTLPCFYRQMTTLLSTSQTLRLAGGGTRHFRASRLQRALKNQLFLRGHQAGGLQLQEKRSWLGIDRSFYGLPALGALALPHPLVCLQYSHVYHTRRAVRIFVQDPHESEESLP